jgi:Big-like domain-containing protein
VSSNRAFYGAFALLIAGLSIGILVLALLTTTSGPRVRQVIVQNPGSGGAAIMNQGLTVVFDRPVEGSDFDAAVDIQPEVEHTVSHRNQQLSVSVDQNLLSNTEYVLKIRPELEDTLGGLMKHEYDYEFTTAEPQFTYLERNYDRGAVDRIVVQAPLSQESSALFGADKISRFARNASFLAVVLPRADDTDELRVIDLQGREEIVVDLPSNVRVDNLQFSPLSNQFVFITRESTIGANPSESNMEAYANRLYRYDIDGEQLEPVDASSEVGNVDNAVYSRDGQALLYQTLDGEYYLTGAVQPTEPSLLGK